MENITLINWVASLPLHGLLLIAIIVLWRDNQKLRDQLEVVRLTSAGNTALLLGQGDSIDHIKTQIIGFAPQRKIDPIEPYEAMPPYRKPPRA